MVCSKELKSYFPVLQGKTAFQTSKLGLEEKCTFKIHELLEY